MQSPLHQLPLGLGFRLFGLRVLGFGLGFRVSAF